MLSKKVSPTPINIYDLNEMFFLLLLIMQLNIIFCSSVHLLMMRIREFLRIRQSIYKKFENDRSVDR